MLVALMASTATTTIAGIATTAVVKSHLQCPCYQVPIHMSSWLSSSLLSVPHPHTQSTQGSLFAVCQTGSRLLKYAMVWGDQVDGPQYLLLLLERGHVREWETEACAIWKSPETSQETRSSPVGVHSLPWMLLYFIPWLKDLFTHLCILQDHKLLESRKCPLFAVSDQGLEEQLAGE